MPKRLELTIEDDEVSNALRALAELKTISTARIVPIRVRASRAKQADHPAPGGGGLGNGSSRGSGGGGSGVTIAQGGGPGAPKTPTEGPTE